MKTPNCITQFVIMVDKDYYILGINIELLRNSKKLIMPTLLLLINSHIILGIASQGASGSNENTTPGFQVVISLLTLGVIAFLAPYLRRDKSTDNQ